MALKTRDLANGLRLIISRRRMALTQAEAAKKHKVSLYQYRRWEEDKQPGAPDVAVGRLAPHEQCYVERITRGVSLAAQAKKMGISRWWLRQMERGTANPERLIAYWS